MATIQINLDDDTKTAVDSLFESIGLDTESALKVYISTIISQSGIPFPFGSYAMNIDSELETTRKGRLKAKGSLRGKVRMSDDFDAPLEDLKEYME